MKKNSFCRFSPKCPMCYLMMLKRFLGVLRHSKQAQKLLDTSRIVWKFFLIEISTFGSHFLLTGLTNSLKMAGYERFESLKAFSRWKLWPRYDTESCSDHNVAFYWAVFVYNDFLLKKKTILNSNTAQKSTQIRVKTKENNLKKWKKKVIFFFIKIIEILDNLAVCVR